LASQADYLSPDPTPFIPDKDTASKIQCEVLGQAFKRQASEVEAAGIQAILNEELLDTLLRICPQGQVVDLDIWSESDDESFLGQAADEPQSRRRSNFHVAKIISPLFPNAQSVVWLPLWDHQKSRWMAGMLSWSSNTHRGLGVEELHYFKVFAHSIISEVSRVNWISTEKSKFDLLSSLSHELRSPLHGILASAELLHATTINSAQQEMIKMIETSGLTLLETTDHLLTYCKINNSRRAKEVTGKDQHNELLVLETDFDLALLVEEVTSIIYTGQKDPSLFTRLAIVPPSTDIHGNAESPCSPVKPSIVVRINQSHSWKIRSLSGAWRRIVMNILGNSLKWTAQGIIEISLCMLRNPETPGKPTAHISIIDTGRGIAPDFLKHELFTPFAQEDRLVEGVGLGLSIVHQLVASLDGHISVRSELGLGTQVDIYIPVYHIAEDNLDPGSSEMIERSPSRQVCLVAFNGYPDIKETPTGMLTAESKRKLSIQGMLADVVMSKAGWTVSLAESLEKGHGDIAILESSTLEAIATPDLLPSIISENRFQFLLILETKPSIFDKALMPNLIWVSPPFGPLKIQKAIEKASAPCRSQADLNIISNTNQPMPVEQPMEQLSIHPEKPSPGEFTIRMPHSIDRPRTSEAKMQCHVLVVDDNDINLKVRNQEPTKQNRFAKLNRSWPHSCAKWDVPITLLQTD
jgi:signal transduction histidine kinase